MRRLIFAVVLGLSLGAAAASAARALDPETLRRDLTEALEGGFSAYATQAFRFTDVVTTAQGEAVRAEILGLALPLPDTGGRLELGDLAFTVAAAGDGLYRVSEVETSSRATLFDEAGNKTVLINYRLERLAGIWSVALRNFLDVDAAISGIEAIVPAENIGFAIAGITAVNRSSTRAGGLTDMEGEPRATGLRMVSPAVGTIQVGELYMDYSFLGQDLTGYQSFVEAFQALGNADTKPDPSALAAILERLAEINILPEGFIERFRLTDLTYIDPDRQPRFRLDEVEVNITAGDLHLPLGYGSLGIKVAGVQVESPGGQAVDPMQALVPRYLGLIASVERVPMRLLWQSFVRAMALAAAAGEQGPEADAIGEAMGEELQDAINRAGPILRLDRLDLETPSGRVVGEGELRVDASTAIGVRGRLDLTITGLDEIIAVAMGAEQSGQADPEMQGNLMFLMLLKSMARREAGTDGKPVDRLEVAVTPAGDILINGQPFTMAPRQ